MASELHPKIVETLSGISTATLTTVVLKKGLREQERFETWIFGRVQAVAVLPGLYPPNDENKARYTAFKREQG